MLLAITGWCIKNFGYPSFSVLNSKGNRKYFLGFFMAEKECFLVLIQMWHQHQPEVNPLWQPMCVCLCPLRLIAFVLLPSSGAASGSSAGPGDACRCNVSLARPRGHSHLMSCLESAREHFWNQTEHCCTGYPLWLKLDSCRPTASVIFIHSEK